jgi:hypothetical protein
VIWLSGVLVLGVLALVVVRALRQGRERLYQGAARSEVFARWNGKCAYRFPVMWHRCSGRLQVDHQVPASVGLRGRTRVRNGQPLCGSMNRRKSASRNSMFVAKNAIPAIGHVWYAGRWFFAELVRPLIRIGRK